VDELREMAALDVMRDGQEPLGFNEDVEVGPPVGAARFAELLLPRIALCASALTDEHPVPSAGIQRSQMRERVDAFLVCVNLGYTVVSQRLGGRDGAGAPVLAIA
jgi:hypothetical protein